MPQDHNLPAAEFPGKFSQSIACNFPLEREFPPNMVDFSANPGGFFRQPWWIFPLTIAVAEFFFHQPKWIFPPAFANFSASPGEFLGKKYYCSKKLSSFRDFSLYKTKEIKRFSNSIDVKLHQMLIINYL